MNAIYNLYSEFSSLLLPIVPAILVIALLIIIIIDDCPYPGLPVVGQGKYEFGSLIAKYRFLVSAKDIIEEGLRNVS
jgi:hypothetical protein